MTDKPQTAAGYRAEETAQVVAACLTLAGALGDLYDELCIVGGLVPSMICDTRVDPSALDGGAHVGTSDLDVALETSVLDDERYKEIASRLHAKGFAPDTKDSGALVRQRWRWREQKVTVDFLIPPAPGTDPDKVRVQSLESDFAALVVKPLGLAFHERLGRTLDGHTLDGDRIERTVYFCGPAAFIALKAFAFSKRTEPKDAYDLAYVLRRWPEGMGDIATRMREHAEREPTLVIDILDVLDRDFENEDSIGPRAASRFHDGTIDGDRVADAHGAVRDVLDACAGLGIEWSRRHGAC
ncbi:MAG: nucleotidyl transferase AbiEii/AbiGii toxin family protein [Solirubrobacteraceae bacterium]